MLFIPDAGRLPKQSNLTNERILHLTLAKPTALQTGQELALGKIAAAYRAIPWWYTERVHGPVYTIEQILNAAREIEPTLIFAQIHGRAGARLEDYTKVICKALFDNLRRTAPSATVVNWCGDSYDVLPGILPPWTLELAQLIDLSLFSNCTYPEWLINTLPGANAGYLQCAFDPCEFDYRTTVQGAHEILFVGQNYAHIDHGNRSVLARAIEAAFPDKLALYGAGWQDFVSNKGTISFLDSSHLYGKGLTIGPSLARDRQLRRCISGRLARSMASGAVYLMQSFNDYAGLGIIDRQHVLVWHELTDLLVLLRAWTETERESEKQQLRVAAHTLAFANWTWDVAVTELAWLVQQVRSR